MRKAFLLLILIFIYTIFSFLILTREVFACDYSKGTITSITPPEGVSVGDILTINGGSFGERQKLFFNSSYNVPIYWTTVLGEYGRMEMYETSIA